MHIKLAGLFGEASGSVCRCCLLQSRKRNLKETLRVDKAKRAQVRFTSRDWSAKDKIVIGWLMSSFDSSRLRWLNRMNGMMSSSQCVSGAIAILFFAPRLNDKCRLLLLQESSFACCTTATTKRRILLNESNSNRAALPLAFCLFRRSSPLRNLRHEWLDLKWFHREIWQIIHHYRDNFIDFQKTTKKTLIACHVTSHE